MRVTESYERWTRVVKQLWVEGVGWGVVGWWWGAGDAIIATVLDTH